MVASRVHGGCINDPLQLQQHHHHHYHHNRVLRMRIGCHGAGSLVTNNNPQVLTSLHDESDQIIMQSDHLGTNRCMCMECLYKLTQCCCHL